MSRSGKKSEHDTAATNPDHMSVILQIVQQQADDRKQFEETLRQERRAAEERFTQLLQAMQQTRSNSNNAETNQTNQPTNMTLLSGTPSMAEFTSWSKSWEDYSLINRVDQHDLATQLAALRTHMSPDFQAVFADSITIESVLPNEPTVAEALTAIHTFIRGVQNIIVDRFHFFTRRQQPGESFEHFFVALRQLCRLADVCNHCTDTQLITLIIIGVQDPDLQKKLLEIRPAPNLNQILTVCQAFESAGTDQALTSSVVAQAGRQEKSRAYNNTSRPHQSQPQNRSDRAYKGTTCYWCAGDPHPSRNQCPAKDTTCNFCLIKGHYQKACKKRLNDRKTETSVNKVVNTAKVMEATMRSGITPVSLHINAYGREVQLLAYPDTGADINVLPEKFLHKLGLTSGSLRPANITIMAYNGKRDSPIGFFPAKISIGESTLDSKIYVQRGTSRFLLSGLACEKLGIISFPLQRAQAVTTTAAPER